jgi:hypothetical protein
LVNEGAAQNRAIILNGLGRDEKAVHN